jgi:hypothetical protein
MKTGDLVKFDAQIIKRIFPRGLFDGDIGTVLSKATKGELYAHQAQIGGPAPYIDTKRPVWWILWWTGDLAGRRMYCEEQYLHVIDTSAPTSHR